MANDEAVDKLAAQIEDEMYRTGIERAINKAIKGMRDAQWDEPRYVLMNEEMYRWATNLAALPDVCSPAGLKKLFPALKG